MANWNLPPGCTDADVDRAMGGDEPRCWFCHGETDELEWVYWRGDRRLSCGECAARAEDN